MASTLPPSFGQLLKRYRIAAGLTQEALAELAGLSARAISDIERGLRQSPYTDTLNKLADALHLSTEERARFEAAARRRSSTGVRPAPEPLDGQSSTLPETALPVSGEASPTPPWSELLVEGPLPIPTQPGHVLLGRIGQVAWPRVRAARATRLIGVLLMGTLLAGTMLSASVAHRPQCGTLYLATDLPTSGENSADGKSVENAVNLAVEQNQHLGDGYTLKAINRDDRGPFDTVTGPKNVERMVPNTCIVGMVGPYNSNLALQEMPIAAQAGLLMISPSNTLAALTSRSAAKTAGVEFDQLHPPGKPISYFRVVPNDVVVGVAEADFSFLNKGARSAFVINDRNPFGIALTDGFRQEFLDKGGTIVGDDSILPDKPALIAGVAYKIVASSPDVVFYGGIPENGVGLLKVQLVQLGYTGPLVGGDDIAFSSIYLAQARAEAANGTYASVAAADPSTFTAGAAAGFVRDYHNRYPGLEPLLYSDSAYDAAMVVITAIRNLIHMGADVTRSAVIAQVQHMHYQGVTGSISFDPNGDVKHGVISIYSVQNGQWVYIQQINV